MKEVKKYIPKDGEIHILVDGGAFLIPYLQYNLVMWNRVNITPLAKLLELYFNTTASNPTANFYIFIDNGIPKHVSMMNARYKKNRNHSIRRREDAVVSANLSKSHPYSINRTLIQSIFTDLGHGVYFFNEADYQLGYILKKLVDSGVDTSRCFVFSHDNDLVALLEYANVFHRVRKNKQIHLNFYPIGSYDMVVDKLRVETYEEYVIMKALLGDKVDNIMPPMLITKRFVTSLFNRYKHEFGHLTLDRYKACDIISEKGLLKYKDSENYDAFLERVVKEFLTNCKIFDVFNCEWVFGQSDKNYIDIVFETQIKHKINVNMQKVADTIFRVSKTYYDLFKKWHEVVYKKRGFKR